MPDPTLVSKPHKQQNIGFELIPEKYLPDLFHYQTAQPRTYNRIVFLLDLRASTRESGVILNDADNVFNPLYTLGVYHDMAQATLKYSVGDRFWAS